MVKTPLKSKKKSNHPQESYSCGEKELFQNNLEYVP
jgi:hypothetical protein